MNPILFNQLIWMDVYAYYSELFEFADPDIIHTYSYEQVKLPFQKEDTITLCIGVYNLDSGINTVVERITF